MIKIAIHGCGGKMGRVLAQMAAAHPKIMVAAGIDPIAKADEFEFPVFGTLSACDQEVDVLIDFSLPESIGGLLDGAQKKAWPVIIATTGHSEKELDRIQAAAEKIPIFRASNMSLGINLMCKLLQQAASVLGESFDIEIIERHHNQKKDAPSGTAYTLAEAINEVFGGAKEFTFGRHTRTERRQPKEIGIHAIRGGTIVGDHQVVFAGKDEIVEIRHMAYSRQIFAAGALAAAVYLMGKTPGYYTMQEMIAERSAVTDMYASEDDALVSAYGIPDDPSQLATLFSTIGEQGIIIDMISQTAPVEGLVSISFTLPRTDSDRAMSLLEGFKSTMPKLNVAIDGDITKISVEGPGMATQSGIAAQVFQVMADNGIGLKTITTSETKISYIIHRKDGVRAVEAIRNTFNI